MLLKKKKKITNVRLLIEFCQAGDSEHRPERVRGLRVRESVADVHGRLRLTPRVVPVASL